MSGNSDMHTTLKGVVRDHRIPSDYKYHFNQPFFSRTFLRNLNRWYWNRMVTKQNWAQPMTIIFVRNRIPQT